MQRRCSLLHLSQACRGMLQPHAMPGSNQSVLLSLQQWAQLHVACDMQARGAWQGCHSFHSSPSLADFITLNNISDNPGAKHQGRRLGRGIGSSKGKTAGRGHKGQKARTGRSPKEGFEGGQTPLRIRVGKRGFTNPFQQDLRVVNLDALAERIKQSRLDTSSLITMKGLQGAGLLDTKADRGVKLLGRGAKALNQPVHIQVSQASHKAKAAIEAAGGSVTTVYYNPLGLRALLKPEWFAKKGRLMPRAARPPPKLAPKFDRVGQLPVPSSLPTVPEGAAVP